jgi:predicted CopG family antitoxin
MVMGETMIPLNDEAYCMLKAQKKKGESFSDLILRTFGNRDPIAILTYLQKRSPNHDLADAVETASEELSRNLKLERVKL